MLIRRRKQNSAKPKKLKKEGKPLAFSLLGAVRPLAQVPNETNPEHSNHATKQKDQT